MIKYFTDGNDIFQIITFDLNNWHIKRKQKKTKRRLEFYIVQIMSLSKFLDISPKVRTEANFISINVLQYDEINL